MGNWAIHIEGHGIHDNGKDEDADVMMRDFVNRLAIAGQAVHSATITIGSAKGLIVTEGTGRIESPSEYRPLP